jgi:type I restriction enzyme S subunit
MKFLAYKLSTLAKNYVSYVGNPKLMNNVMANIELSLPDNKKEQEQIADVLSTIDRAIAQTEAIIAKQQRIKTGLMQDLLTKGIDENGNIRSEATHEFKDSAIGRIPEEWNMSSLAECSHRVVVGLASSTTHAYRDVGIPMRTL